MNNLLQKGYGAMTILIITFVLIAGVAFFYRPKFEKIVVDNDGTHECRPHVQADGSIKPGAPEIMAPSYQYDGAITSTTLPDIHADLVPYRLIKSKIAINFQYTHDFFSPAYVHDSNKLNEVKCGNIFVNGLHHNHFCQWVHKGLQVSPNPGGAPQYAVLFPANYTEGHPQYQGMSEYDSELPPAGEDMQDGYRVFRFSNYHVIFLLHLNKDGGENNPNNTVERRNYPYVDAYQQVQANNHALPVTRLPESVLRCKDIDMTGVKLAVQPVMESSPDKRQLQYGWFLVEKPIVKTWWTPACKPAINLYPQKDTLVNVQVAVNGLLSYTDPLYPTGGWTVLAHPSGNLQYLSNSLVDSKGIVQYPSGMFPYLYYEAKIHDESITKPTTGFVKAYAELPAFYDEVLPKLGLSAKETKQFKEYWIKALPKSPYYFVGVIPQDQVDRNEPLAITPRQDTLIRVRLYFEALKEPKAVTAPTFATPARKGFTVVDWGGMVKQDKDHPFTCSM